MRVHDVLVDGGRIVGVRQTDERATSGTLPYRAFESVVDSLTRVGGADRELRAGGGRPSVEAMVMADDNAVGDHGRTPMRSDRREAD